MLAEKRDEEGTKFQKRFLCVPRAGVVLTRGLTQNRTATATTNNEVD